MTDDITLHGREFTVHAREKISTGDYENAEYHVSISGEIWPDDPLFDAGGVPVSSNELDPEARKELKARLLGLQKDAQEVVERAAENRVALPESEDWGVPRNDH